MRIFFLICCASLLLGGCQRPIIETDLVGRYTANFGNGTDTLELRSDGTYLHVFRQPGASTDVRNEGSWSMALSEGRDRVAFRDFVWALNTSGAQLRELSGSAPKPVLWTTQAYRSSGGVRLVANADLGQYYQKTK
jgi:hypothetical protein